MQFDLDDTQTMVVESLASLLRSRVPDHPQAGVYPPPTYDRELERQLTDNGFMDVADAGDPESLTNAILIAELVSQFPVCLPVGWRIFLKPFLDEFGVRWPFAVLLPAERPQRVRFADSVESFVVVEEDQVVVFDAQECQLGPAEGTWGYPTAAVGLGSAGRHIDASPSGLLDLWQLGLTAEILGAATAAIDRTLEYAKEREQFGRPIGSFQALRHRLANLATQLEGTRLSARYAAWNEAESGSVALATTAAQDLARQTFWECHQVHGAIGLTREYVLHQWTLRLRTLMTEAGGSMGAGERAFAANLSKVTT